MINPTLCRPVAARPTVVHGGLLQEVSGGSPAAVCQIQRLYRPVDFSCPCIDKMERIAAGAMMIADSSSVAIEDASSPKSRRPQWHVRWHRVPTRWLSREHREFRAAGESIIDFSVES